MVLKVSIEHAVVGLSTLLLTSIGLVKFLYDHPEGFDPPVTDRLSSHVKECNKFTTVTAKKGDVLLLHGLLPHAASPNYLRYARVITNPHVALHSPHNFNRADGNYVSLL